MSVKKSGPGQEPESGDGPALVEIPRFMGRNIPSIDRLIIKVVPPVLIAAVIVMVIMDPEGAAGVISNMRTFVTGRFTWLFIVYSLIAVGVCIWLAASRVGKIRLGGAQGKA